MRNPERDTAPRYLKAIEAGAAACLTSLFTLDEVFEQLPNRGYPNSMRANVSPAGEAFEKGRKLFFPPETYESPNHQSVG